MNHFNMMLPKIQITSQHLVIGLAGTFALISVQNVAHFFTELHHPVVSSWTLGLAIGAALVVLAHLLSEVDMRETRAFLGLLTVTLILVVLSAIIQGNVYAKELGSSLGYLLAFTLAATGEIVLPLAYSWHRDAQRRQAVHDAARIAEEKASQALVTVLSHVDVTKAQAKAEKKIESLIVAHVESTVRKLMPIADSSQSSVEARTEAREGINVSPMTNTQDDAQSAHLPPNGRSFGPENLAAANIKRTGKAEERRQQLLRILDTEYNGVDADQLNKTALGDRLGAKRQTIGRDLAALEEAGLLSMNSVIAVRGEGAD